MASTQKRPLPIIRVFVSSTFSDLKHERNALHAQVWPELERYCQQRGFTFQAIDLRWGVPAEAGLDHRTMRICFEELRRSQETSPAPNFLILIGNRYGWRPLPEVISVAEFQRLETAASEVATAAANDQATDVRLRRAPEVLQQWYLLDENAKPFGEQNPAGEYVLRSRKTLLDGVDYGNQPDATGKLRDTAAWVDVQFVLWSIINDKRAFPAADLAGRFQTLHETSPGTAPSSVRFQASATEQEIWQGALQVENADRHVIAAVRKIDDLDAFPNRPRRGDLIDLKDDETPDDDARQALADLKAELESRLSNSPIIRSTCQWAIDQDNNPTGDITTSHLDDFCREILDRFKSIIIEQINAYWGCDLSADDATLAQLRGSQQELDLECADHLRFATERAPEKTFVGRESELQRIRDYLHSETNQPFVVHGPSGSGKTALLGKIIQEVTPPRSADGTRAKTGPIVLTRFIGTTPESSNLRSLLSSLCRELRQDFEMPASLPTDLNELIDEFYSQLGKATAARPVFVLLDALDQLDAADHGRSVFWIRSQLSSTADASCHARMVVSCLSPSDEFPEDSEACEPFRELKLRPLLGNHELGALDEKEARELFANWLHEGRRSVSKTQQDMIWSALRKSSACRQPLFLKVLFEEAKLWRSYDADVRLNEPETSNDYLGALLKQLFDRLCFEANHGKLLVERTLGYIAAARRGLSETEILEILFADLDYKKHLDEVSKRDNHTLPTEPPRIPIAIWSRLRADLAPYLTERTAPGGNVLNFYHRQVAEEIRKRYVTAADQIHIHRKLAEYFGDYDKRPRYVLDNMSWQLRTVDERVLDELPWQLQCASEWETLAVFLSSLAAFRSACLSDRTFEWMQYWQRIVMNHEGVGKNVDIPDRYFRTFQMLTSTDKILVADALGQFLYGLGCVEAAQKYFDLEADALHDAPLLLAANLNDQGLVFKDQGDLGKALEVFDQAEKLLKEHSTADPNLACKVLASVLMNKATTLRESGDTSRSAPMLQKSLELMKQSFGNCSAEAATVMQSLGNFCTTTSDFRAALDWHLRAYEIRRERLGKDHRDVGLSLGNLANPFLALHHFHRGMQLKERSLEILKGHLGENHPFTQGLTKALTEVERLAARAEKESGFGLVLLIFDAQTPIGNQPDPQKQSGIRVISEAIACQLTRVWNDSLTHGSSIPVLILSCPDYDGSVSLALEQSIAKRYSERLLRWITIPRIPTQLDSPAALAPLANVRRQVMSWLAEHPLGALMVTPLANTRTTVDRKILQFVMNDQSPPKNVWRKLFAKLSPFASQDIRPLALEVVPFQNHDGLLLGIYTGDNNPRPTVMPASEWKRQAYSPKPNDEKATGTFYINLSALRRFDSAPAGEGLTPLDNWSVKPLLSMATLPRSEQLDTFENALAELTLLVKSKTIVCPIERAAREFSAGDPDDIEGLVDWDNL